MTITLPFDILSSDLWMELDDKFNRQYINFQLDYLMQIYKKYGYLYLSRVYEAFGLKWNPCNENSCWILADGDKLGITILYTYGGKAEELKMES